MAHDAFISYSTHDKAIADATCHTLETHRIRCWYAPRDISSGAIWAEAIIDAIGASRIFVLLFSDGSNRSQQVLREVSEAVSRGIPIIPVRVEDVVPTKAMAYYLGTIQWLDALTPEMDRHLERLVRQVQALLGVDEGPPPAAVAGAAAPAEIVPPASAATAAPPAELPAEAGTLTPGEPRARRKLRPLALGLVLVAVALLAAGLGWALSRGRGEGRATEPAAVPTTGAVQATAAATPASPAVGTETTTSAALPSSTVRPAAAAAGVPTPAPLPPAKPKEVPTPLTLAGTLLPEPAAILSPANAAEVVMLARWGRGGASDLAYSRDGTLLAVAGAAGATLYDGTTLEPLREIESDEWLHHLALSPDGQTLAAGGGGTGSGQVYLWRTADGAPLDALKGKSSELHSLAFSPDGALLAVGDGSRTVSLWRLADRSVVRTLDVEGVAWSLSFSPDGQALAVASVWDDPVQVFWVSDGTLLNTLQHPESVYAVAFSPDGQRLATGCEDKTVRLWRASDGALLGALEGHQGGVQSVAFSADGILLTSGGADFRAGVWQVSDGTLVHMIEGVYDAGSSLAVAFSPGGQKLAGASRGHVFIWNLADGKLASEIKGYANGRGHLALDPAGGVLAIAANMEPVQIWSARDGTWLLNLEATARGLAFSPDGRVLALGDGGSITTWSPSGERLGEVQEYAGDVTALAFDGAGELLASGGQDKAVRLWRAGDLSLLRTLEGHTGWVQDVALSPDGKIVASAPREDSVRLWSAEDGSLLRTLEGPAGAVYNCIAFSPDGKDVAAGLNDESVLLWQVADGTLLRSWGGLGGMVTSVAFSPDGSLLAAGIFDHSVRLLDVSAGVEVARLAGHTYPVQAVAFSGDGNLLYSTGDDGTVRVWGVPQSE